MKKVVVELTKAEAHALSYMAGAVTEYEDQLRSMFISTRERNAAVSAHKKLRAAIGAAASTRNDCEKP